MNPDMPAPGMMRICALASGSRGNAVFVADDNTAILVDAGLSGREIERRMAAAGISPGELDAILVSHEHGDHIRGVGILARRFGLPVYIARETEKAADGQMGRIADVRYFEPGRPFSLRSLKVHPFSTSHDAANPVGFTLCGGGRRVGIATDLGVVTRLVLSHLMTCDLLLLEANHDPEMLINGPYPWHLKQRIRGRTGHLSNHQSRDLLQELLPAGRLRHVILGHLSEQNNAPECALATVKEALNGTRSVGITLACQNLCSGMVAL